MSKVAIIGNAGGGKSTLEKKLSISKGLPLLPVDKIQWKPKWTPAPQEEIRTKLDDLIQKELWIIDGWGPWDCIEKRFEAADTIIFVDFPIVVHLWWAAKRQIRALFMPWTIDKPTGCNLIPVTLKLFKMIRRIHRKQLPRLSEMIHSFKAGRDVFHLRSPKELRAFSAEHC